MPLGSGEITGFTHIMYVDPALFDSARTRDIAAEIERNEQETEGGRTLPTYSSDREDGGPQTLGSGFRCYWSNISEARLIVECAIPGFRIEPSRARTSSRTSPRSASGYLTIDTVTDENALDRSFLERLECVEEGRFVKLYEAPSSTAAFIDRKSNKAVAGILK